MTAGKNRSRRQFLKDATQAGTTAIVAGVRQDGPEARGASASDGPDIPSWVWEVSRMTFGTPGDVARAADVSAQVLHTNLVWPYFPLRADGGGLSRDDAKKLKDLVADCRKRRIRIVLGLPPFPPVSLLEKHPDWRVHPDDSEAVRKITARENDLGTRLCCNLGPWGDYLIDVCAELVADYGIDGFSFDGNYHPPLCFCPACKAGYQTGTKKELPRKADLDAVPYREYLVWRGERLEDHYRRLQKRIKQARADAVLMSWTVNAGRYGHFLHSPRAMPTRLNRIFDLPMQEWWLDETNQGASLLPAFGALYLRATTGGRPCASEPYLMSRGNPYGTDSFPAHERRTRYLLALSCGNVLAESLGWPNHNVTEDFRAVAKLEKYLTRTTPFPWAGMVVSEQTRQFYAYKDIAARFLPHPLGVFRAAAEEHLPLALVNDWDLTADSLARFAVVVLPNMAAVSDTQVAAIRDFVRGGGGLMATGETSLCDELGRPRRDFALADLFGVSFRGRVNTAGQPGAEEAARPLSQSYWKLRDAVTTLIWKEHALLRDARLQQLVPGRSIRFRGPIVRVSEPENSDQAVVRIKPEGTEKASLPAMVVRTVGKGRVVYFAAAVDAALWSYAYPYQRRMVARALEWAARELPPITVRAPMCVQVTHFTQADGDRRRLILHFFNGVNTTANHGLPATDVPLREEVVAIHGIEVSFHRDSPKTFHVEPGGMVVESRLEGASRVVRLPPLETHFILVGDG